MSKRRAHGDGSVFQRSRDGRWVAELDLGWVDGKRKRRTFTAATEKEARQRLRTAMRDLEAGHLVEPSKMSVADFLIAWLNEVVDPSGRKPKTKAFYRFNVERYLVPTIGNVRLDRLSRRDVQLLIAGLGQRGKGPRTIQAVHSTLRAALCEAVKRRLLADNPAQDVEVPRPTRDPAVVHAVGREACEVLLRAAPGERLGEMFVLMLMLGLRKGEVLALRWSRIDFEQRTLVVDSTAQRHPGVGMVIQTSTKTGRVVVHALAPSCIEALRVRRARQAEERLRAGAAWNDLDLVFSTLFGAVLDEKVPNVLMNRVLAEAGLPSERVHNLRHTSGTAAGQVAGGDLHVVKNHLGHASITTTVDMYQHVLPESRRRLADALDEHFNGGLRERA